MIPPHQLKRALVRQMRFNKSADVQQVVKTLHFHHWIGLVSLPVAGRQVGFSGLSVDEAVQCALEHWRIRRVETLGSFDRENISVIS